jgi:HK97 family phage major capsid protein
MMTKRELLSQVSALESEYSAVLAASSVATDPVAHLKAVDAKENELKTVREQLAAVEALEARAKANVTREPARVTSDNEAARPFESVGEQLAAIAYAQSPRGAFQGLGGQIDKRLFGQNLTASGASAAGPADGGFAIGTEFSTALLLKARETARIFPLCTNIPIGEGSDSLELPYIDEISRANGSRWGGVQAYWTGEADAPTATKPKLSRHEIRLESLKCLAYATERLLRNAPAMATVFENAFASEIAFKLDDAIWRGDGVGKPLGFSVQNYGGALMVSVAKKTGQAADTFVIENATSMLSRLYREPGDRIVWLCNPDTIGQFPLLTVGQQPVFLPNNSVAGTVQYGTFLGFPVIPVEQAETLGDKGDVVLANLSKYVVITQGGLRAAQSMHVRFIYDEMTFKWSIDVNGQSSVKQPITPFKGSNTLSPFVTVDARA